MSADRWSKCPLCGVRLAERKAAAMDILESQYGQITSREYVARLRTIEEMKPAKGDAFSENFREDWEISFDGGGLTFGWSGHCVSCGADLNYDVSVPLEDL